MSQQADGEFRGPIPGTGGSGSAGGRPPTWNSMGRPGGPWDLSGAMGRPRLPWFGVFLVLFGGLLILEQLVPGTRAVGSGLVVAAGVALLIAWAVNRHVWQLYAGA